MAPRRRSVMPGTRTGRVYDLHMGETSPAATPGSPLPIVLFDGVCNLCNGSVQFLLKRDPEGRFRFASLQSDAGRSLMAKHGLDADRLSSVALIEDGRVWQESSAALRIARHLPGAWKLLRVFAIVPRPLRDAL